MRAEVLSGHLGFMLLAIVADGPAHGYAIIASLRERSDGAFDLPEGTVYPVLHRLEREGAVKSRWTTHEGRRRRVYSLTAAGRRELDRQRAQWSEFARAVSAVTS